MDAALRALRVVIRGNLEDSERADTNVDKEWGEQTPEWLGGFVCGVCRGTCQMAMENLHHGL